jgi:hypothetical protein
VPGAQGAGRRDLGADLLAPGDLVLGETSDQRVLVVEMEVEGGAGDAGLGDDPLNAEVRHRRAGREQALRRLDDLGDRRLATAAPRDRLDGWR